MPKLTFITKDYRPDVFGATLDIEHETYLFLSNYDCLDDFEEVEINAICFGPKKDNVLLNLEHLIQMEDEILVLYYEDIHKRWTYLRENNSCFILYKKNNNIELKIAAKNIYIRGCYIEPNNQLCYEISDFLNFIELWNGKILCSAKAQLSNESKLFQLNNSLINSSKGKSNISIGTSYIFKGVYNYSYLPSENSKDYIVKSLSGVRSKVVDNHTYENWNKDHIVNLPVLFQQKVNGNDLRVHIIDNNVYAKYSESKDTVDYRYDKSFFNLVEIENIDKQIEDFCIEVASRESNNFLGIDFIKTESSYVVLEANPSPGWSAYYPYDGITKSSFLDNLLKVLKSV